jgi:hypothetical protein
MTDPRITGEMVEAAARAEWEQSTKHSSWSSLNIAVKGRYCDRVEAGLAAALPRIERGVIERLAGEAGNDFEESTMDAAYEVLYKGGCSPVLETVLGVLRLGAAAGVAAERARIVEYVDELRLHDDTGDLLDIGYMGAINDVLAALSPDGGSDAA